MTIRADRRLWAIVAVALVLGALTALPSAAQDPPPPIQVEPLTPRSTFVDDVNLMIRLKYAEGGRTRVIHSSDPSNTVVTRITVQPGARFPWHTHHGPVVVNVAQGELVYINANDCVERSYPTGTAFIDPGHGNVHSAYNPSSSGVTVIYATFFEVPASGPLTLTEGVSQSHCSGIPVGTHGNH